MVWIARRSARQFVSLTRERDRTRLAEIEETQFPAFRTWNAHGWVSAVSAVSVALFYRRRTEHALPLQQPCAAGFADVGARQDRRVAFRTSGGGKEKLAAVCAEP